MPKLFGLNLLPVLIASVAFFFVGFLWYGLIFTDAWMAAHDITPAAESDAAVWMAGGFLITLAQVVGLGLVLKWRGASDIMAALKTAGVLWLVFALPLIMYGYIYLPAHDSTLLMIDASHILVGWLLSALVLSVMKA